MDSRIAQIEQLLQEGKKFTSRNFCIPNKSGDEFGGMDTPEWLAWKTRTANVIRQVVSDESSAAELVATGMTIQTEGYYTDNFERAKSTLLKALEMTLGALKDDAFNELRKPTSESVSAALSNKVFVVHGHDHALKTEMENFLHQIGLEPIVLHRQPDQGQTIIEKFEQNSDVGYTFVLLTPDEIAYTMDQDGLPDKDRKKERRSRPNVIFEFGYFVGRLGRSRVCCLYKGDVVLPSDLNGLVYKKIDGAFDSQAFSIIKELKAAGYQIKL
jgi:predicted nucleotide-binding protein